MSVQELSQSEIWDDSALVESWNEALEEYKKYHSIAARGERIEEIIAVEESADIRKSQEALKDDKGASLPAWEPQDEKSTDANQNQLGAELPSDQNSFPATQPPQSATDFVPSAAPLPMASSMPHAILHTVQDDSLKNLMMSWYYAGYYTGLHDGQRKSQADQQNGKVNGQAG